MASTSDPDRVVNAVGTSAARGGSMVLLESVITTAELDRRPSRPPDYQAENEALAALVQALADSPETILQRLVETAMDLCQAGSAGISLLNEADDGRTFIWPAIAGQWTPHVGGGTPRDFGPCGVVLDTNAIQLFSHPERYYPYLIPVVPPIAEALLTPFSVAGQSIGTVWVIAHDERRPFDREDLRQLVSLGRFAAAAYQGWRAYERAQQAIRVRDEFLSVAAHELRTPIMSLSANLQLLLRQLERTSTLDPNMVSARLESLNSQTRRLNQFVTSLLDLSRLEAGKLTLAREVVDLVALVQRAAAEAALKSDRHPIEVRAPTTLFATVDPFRIEQVLANLLDNAIKYSPAGGPITVTVAQSAPESITVTVTDAGIGIPLSAQARIFDRYFQAHGDLGISGMGLGLFICKQIVELHGGNIQVESTPAGGSRFVVQLPTSAP